MKKRLRDGPPIELFEVLYTDFTTIDWANGHRSAKMMPIIGHTSKLVFGWSLAPRRHRTMACRAWDEAQKTLEAYGVAQQERIVHQDQDSVYTSDRWVDQLLEDGIRLSYSTNGAKGNTYMESFNGHFKQPIESCLLESESMSEVKGVIQQRVDKWNNDRRHSSLGQIAPRAYIEEQREGN